MNMKKTVGLVLGIMILWMMTSGAWADGALYDKDIQFPGFTFGETFASLKENLVIEELRNQNEYAEYSRMVAVPVFRDLMYDIGERSPVSYYFYVRAQGQSVAGHDATTHWYFLYPSRAAAESLDLYDAVFYGGYYDFDDGDSGQNYQDLKQKLTSVYGEPYIEGTDSDGSLPDAIWGPFEEVAQQADPADIIEEYQEAIDYYGPYQLAAWKSSTNSGVIVLIRYGKEWGSVRLSYFDTSMDETLIDFYVARFDEDNIEGL